MPYFSKEEIARAREMDLLTYLQNFEPRELVHVTGNTYCTREHDSLKISNGKWMWWSRGFGGASALDYLVKVRGDPFIDAVGKILGKAANEPSIFVPKSQQDRSRRLLLPERAENNNRVTAYLMQRGISRSIIENCIDRGLISQCTMHICFRTSRMRSLAGWKKSMTGKRNCNNGKKTAEAL